jgi:hypothetical protein
MRMNYRNGPRAMQNGSTGLRDNLVITSRRYRLRQGETRRTSCDVNKPVNTQQNSVKQLTPGSSPVSRSILTH